MIKNIYAYMLNRRFIIVLILLLAIFLRFNQLNTLPALNADEAAIGYNAYSLIQTGRDEHGNPWPIHFESFGDWKPGLFFYIVLPFVWAFGLNEWAVRIPGALLGVGTVWLVYLLVRELFPKQEKFSISKKQAPLIFNFQFSIGEIAAIFLAISPWHIHFSRGGWEVNAGTFFIVLGLWLFLKGIRDTKWWYFSLIAFIASLYTYHSARIIVPLLGLGLLFFYKNAIFNNLKKIAFLGVFSIFLIAPLVKDLLGQAGLSRASGVSIFADQGIVERINEQRGEHGNMSGVVPITLHNKLTNYPLEFLENWGEHFWGEFLFFGGDEIERNRVPEMGQLYLFQLPILIIGFLAIARNLRDGSASWRIILWWLIIAPTAASITFQSPHALRAHNMVIPLIIISAYGLTNCLVWAEKISLGVGMFSPGRWSRIGTWGTLVVVLLIAWEFSRYLHQYYVHMSKEYPFSSQYGVKELVSYVNDNYDKYPKFLITDRYDQPYILFLFYLRVYDQTSSVYMQYPPEKFQGERTLTERDRFGFSTVRDFDKFHFEEVKNWNEILESSRGAVIIGTDKEIPDESNITKEIYFPNGEPAFQIVTN